MTIKYENIEVRLDSLWSGYCFLVGDNAYIITDKESEIGTRECVCLEDGSVRWFAGDSMVNPVKSKVVIGAQS